MGIFMRIQKHALAAALIAAMETEATRSNIFTFTAPRYDLLRPTFYATGNNTPDCMRKKKKGKFKRYT
jgi:hypothetical protein